jgi:hypothetical protein
MLSKVSTDYGIGKAVENLPQLQKRLDGIIDRYLDVQQDILETFVDREQLRKLTQPALLPNGRRIPGLKLDHPRQLALMHSLVRFCYLAAEGTFTKLLYFLVWRSVKVRYKQTAIGVVWVLVQPLLTVLAFTLFFGKLAKLPSQGLPYPVFYFAAAVPWMYFSTALTKTTNVLVENQNVITGEGLGKRYHRSVFQSSPSLRDHLDRFLKSPLSFFRRPKEESFWALKDVSIEVHEGELLG